MEHGKAQLIPYEAADAALTILGMQNVALDDVREALNRFQSAMMACENEAVKAAGLKRLSAGINADSKYASAFGSVAGRYIELGFDTASISAAFEACLAAHGPSVIALSTAIWADLEAAEEGPDAESAGVDMDAVIEAHLKRSPKAAKSWYKLEQLYVPLVALLSKSPNVRARSHQLYDFSLASNFHGGAYWLNRILPTYDSVPIIVIEPETGLGIKAQMSGVTSHVQMHILLMDIFPNPVGLQRGSYSSDDVMAARGQGGGTLSESVRIHWNLVNWRSVPEYSGRRKGYVAAETRHWIWHEGKPSDIPMFGDALVVILDPPAMSRSFSWSRDFMHLDADITAITELRRYQVDAILAKMHAAANPI